jgi:hypothetical protein
MPTVAPACPGAENVFYEAENGKWFLLECSVDHLSNDLSAVYGASYTECCEACANWPNCEGVVWDPTQGGFPCYLKSEIGDTTPSSNLWAAIAITPPTGFPPDFETQITSTMTALPAGASLQTLTGGYTECTVITTTSPGSSSPTIVPVIVPPIGPPLIVSITFVILYLCLCVNIY